SLTAATAIQCGRLLDVRKGELIPNAVILIDGSTITAVGPNLAIPAGAERIDLSQSTCLPGLIDVHDHLTTDPSNTGYEGLGISVPRSAITGVKNARLTL